MRGCAIGGEEVEKKDLSGDICVYMYVRSCLLYTIFLHPLMIPPSPPSLFTSLYFFLFSNTRKCLCAHTLYNIHHI